MSEEKPKYGKMIEGLEQLSLGISIVVAILIGVGIGIFLKKTFGYPWLFWLGVFWGVGGAILNIKKAYQKQKKELDKLKDDPKYSYKPDIDDEDEY